MVEKTPTKYVFPWRGVVTAEPFSDGSVLLSLECGHVEPWPSGNTPVACSCTTCDPPTFRGKPFDMSDLGSTEADHRWREWRKAQAGEQALDLLEKLSEKHFGLHWGTEVTNEDLNEARAILRLAGRKGE